MDLPTNFINENLLLFDVMNDLQGLLNSGMRNTRHDKTIPIVRHCGFTGLSPTSTGTPLHEDSVGKRLFGRYPPFHTDHFDPAQKDFGQLPLGTSGQAVGVRARRPKPPALQIDRDYNRFTRPRYL
jgi:hypothetical protein